MNGAYSDDLTSQVSTLLNEVLRIEVRTKWSNWRVRASRQPKWEGQSRRWDQEDQRCCSKVLRVNIHVWNGQVETRNRLTIDRLVVTVPFNCRVYRSDQIHQSYCSVSSSRESRNCSPASSITWRRGEAHIWNIIEKKVMPFFKIVSCTASNFDIKMNESVNYVN